MRAPNSATSKVIYDFRNSRKCVVEAIINAVESITLESSSLTAQTLTAEEASRSCE